MSSARRPRRRAVAIAALALVAAALGACGGEGTKTPSERSRATTHERPATSDVLLAVEAVQDVAYTSERNLDVYRPTTGSGWPAVVHFHGGVSSTEADAAFARAVAQQGVVVFLPEWRSLGPAGGSEDTICAIAFATAHGTEYGAAIDRMTLSGYSTGGYTAVVHALIGDEPPRQVTDCNVDPSIDAPDAVVGGGAPLFAARWARDGRLATNPQWSSLTAEQISTYDPFLLLGRNRRLRVRLVVGRDDVGGNPDVLFPIAESNRDYIGALTDAGYDATLTEVPGGHEGPLTPGTEGLDAYVAVVVETARGG
jgi:acetyl esterase/lipase